MTGTPLSAPVWLQLGPVPVTRPVVITWAIMLILALAARVVGRRLTLRAGGAQAMVEAGLGLLLDQLESVMDRDPRPYLPLIGTLFLLIAACNLSALLPGVEPPTAAIETPAAFAIVVFAAVQIFGIRARGIAGYLKSFAEPSWLLLPLNVLAEFTRTLSLAIRLFGNMMSHSFVLAVLLSLAGLIVPVPFMALGLLIGLIQAYIFTVLAAVFIAAALGAAASAKAPS